MTKEFMREDRYFVFKISDVVEHLTTTEALHLARLYEIQRVGRREAGKSELECVVVESDWPEYEPTWRAIEARVTGAQNVPKAVAYLDLGAGGYMDIGTGLTDEALAALPRGRHMLGIVGTYGIDGYVPAQPAPSVPEGVSFIDTSQLEGVVSTEIVHSYPPPSGWLRAIDEALVTTHIGVANAHDTYEQAKAKLDNLIGFHVNVAIDPAVNGGYKLVLDGWETDLLIVEHAMRMNNWDWSSNTSDDLKRTAYKIISKLLAAPEIKP